MKRFIITGFQPFGPYKFNPVEESTKYIDGKRIGNSMMKGIVLPCTYHGAFQVLKEAISELQPEAIISTGLSSSVRGIRFETTGRNIMNGKYADADGFSPKNIQIINGGEYFLNTNSPNHYLANILHRENIPTELSSDADTFICNSLIYLTSHHLQATGSPIKNAFIHVPWTEDYKERIQLEPHKIMIPKDMLHHSIETIVKNIAVNN